MKLLTILSNFRSFTVVILLLLTGCTATLTQNVHLKYGNPSGANDNHNNYLIVRPEYALSYSCKKGIANWASWQLDRSWLGRTERSDRFAPDTELPEDCYGVRPSDYRRSGYDRGHLVPSGDRTRSQSDNESTFVMTNMIPQSPSNNREVWRELEEYSRELAYQGKELYIIAGTEGIAKKIAQSRVVVPKFTWKVILVLDEPNREITAQNAQAIAVWIPNSEEVQNTDWQEYITSVDWIEKKTGYNFFAELSRGIQNQIEQASYLQ